MTLLDIEEITNIMAAKDLDNWELKDKSLYQELLFKDFKEAMVFINKIADIAEEHNHHPDIRIVWNKVSLEISTHDAGGLTQKDFDLANDINAV